MSVEPVVVSISNPIEDTPAGLHLMDRLREADRRFEDELRDAGGDEAVELKRQIEADYEHKLLYGDDPSSDSQ